VRRSIRLLRRWSNRQNNQYLRGEESWSYSISNDARKPQLQNKGIPRFVFFISRCDSLNLCIILSFVCLNF
jgi:hypothetical protein